MRETKLTGVKVASSCLSSSVATVSLHQASSLFVRRVGCSFQEFHSFTYISPKIPSMISFHTIFQSWHHQQLQSIYFPLILSPSRLFDECENITTTGFWGLISLLKSLLRSYWPAPVAPLGHLTFIIRLFFFVDLAFRIVIRAHKPKVKHPSKQRRLQYSNYNTWRMTTRVNNCNKLSCFKLMSLRNGDSSCWV